MSDNTKVMHMFAVCTTPLKGTAPRVSTIIDRLLFNDPSSAVSFKQFVKDRLKLEVQIYNATVEWPTITPVAYMDPRHCRDASVSFQDVEQHQGSSDKAFYMPVSIIVDKGAVDADLV